MSSEEKKFKDHFVELEPQLPQLQLAIQVTDDPNSDAWKRGVELEDHVFVDVKHYNPDREDLHAYYGIYEDRTIMLSAETTTPSGETVSVSNIRLMLPPGVMDPPKAEGAGTLRTLDDVLDGKLAVFGESEKQELKQLYADATLAEGGTITKPPSSELMTTLDITKEAAKQLKENSNVQLFAEVLKICHQKGITSLLAATDSGYFDMLNQMFAGKGIIKALGPECILGKDPVIVAVYDVEAAAVNFGMEL